MLYGKANKPGKQLEELVVGEKLMLTEKIEDKDILLYLGLTNDANPLYIQHDYTANTSFGKPVVPTIMLTGIITAAISKYLPGPGSYILKQEIEFPHPVYHYEVIQFTFEVAEINKQKGEIRLEVHAQNDDEKEVVQGYLLVRPPAKNKTEKAKQGFSI